MSPVPRIAVIPRTLGAAPPGASMRVVMRTTQRGSPDGITTQTYAAGKEYEIPADLGEVFVREGWADALKAPPAPASGTDAGPSESKVVAPVETKEDAPRVEALPAEGPSDPPPTDVDEADSTLLEYSPEDARELVATVGSVRELIMLRAGEVTHPDFPSGRPLVIEAIDARVKELTGA